MRILQRILDQKKYLLIQMNESKLGMNTGVRVLCLLVQKLILAKIVGLRQLMVVDRLVVVMLFQV